MLIGIEGDLGSAKTTYAVKNIIQDYINGKNIISNTPLYNIKYEEFDIKKFLSNDKTYRKSIMNATILIDEITVYMDCRLSGSAQNIMMGYLVLQSRKRNVDIYFTTQDFDLCDYNRLIKYVKIMVYCQKIQVKQNDGKLLTVKNWRNINIIDLRLKRNNITSFNLYTKPFFKYFDTNYIIEPILEKIRIK